MTWVDYFNERYNIDYTYNIYFYEWVDGLKRGTITYCSLILNFDTLWH